MKPICLDCGQEIRLSNRTWLFDDICLSCVLDGERAYAAVVVEHERFIERRQAEAELEQLKSAPDEVSDELATLRRERNEPSEEKS